MRLAVIGVGLIGGSFALALKQAGKVTHVVGVGPNRANLDLAHDSAGGRNARQLFPSAAGGFRDFTRIASSHPEMWRDICIANRDALLRELTRYSAQLGLVEKLLQAGDGEGLEKLFRQARDARDGWRKPSS